MIWTLLGSLSSVFMPLLTIAGALITLLGMFFGVKRAGRKEALAEVDANTMRGAYEAEADRRVVDTDVYRLSDLDLARLQSKWTVDD